MTNTLKYGFALFWVICTLIGWPCAGVASTEAVVIGAPLPLSGDLQEFGRIMKNSLELAAETINQSGGIKESPVKLRFADTQGNVSMAEKVVKDLAAAGSVMMVGGYASDPTYRMARRAQKKDIPFLISTASADKITQRDWDNIYRLNPPISEYTQGLEDFWIKNFKPKSMAIIFENSMFGTTGAMRMMEFCQDQAIEIQAQITYDRKTASPEYLRALLAPLTAAPPDVIYMIAYLEDAVMLVQQIRALKITSLLCGGAGGFTLEEFTKRAGQDADYVLTAALWSPNVRYPGAMEYFNQYMERYGSMPSYHGAEAYSALLVAADALKRAKSFKSRDIRTALDQIYMQTPFGPVKFYNYENFKHQNSVKTIVLQINDGKFKTVWPPEVATMPFALPPVY
ncbi:MAG: ABC transporter substrate-binding protein [Desulfobacterales bacterium]|nr:ABC transporter substrate-binding protein [Desulfobacterales bacterium]